MFYIGKDDLPNLPELLLAIENFPIKYETPDGIILEASPRVGVICVTGQNNHTLSQLYEQLKGDTRFDKFDFKMKNFNLQNGIINEDGNYVPDEINTSCIYMPTNGVNIKIPDLYINKKRKFVINDKKDTKINFKTNKDLSENSITEYITLLYSGNTRFTWFICNMDFVIDFNNYFSDYMISFSMIVVDNEGVIKESCYSKLDKCWDFIEAKFSTSSNCQSSDMQTSNCQSLTDLEGIRFFTDFDLSYFKNFDKIINRKSKIDRYPDSWMDNHGRVHSCTYSSDITDLLKSYFDNILIKKSDGNYTNSCIYRMSIGTNIRIIESDYNSLNICPASINIVPYFNDDVLKAYKKFNNNQTRKIVNRTDYCIYCNKFIYGKAFANELVSKKDKESMSYTYDELPKCHVLSCLKCFYAVKSEYLYIVNHPQTKEKLLKFINKEFIADIDEYQHLNNYSCDNTQNMNNRAYLNGEAASYKGKMLYFVRCENLIKLMFNTTFDYYALII
jgi:hypothetical protein